jgi:hypothetical protein
MYKREREFILLFVSCFVNCFMFHKKKSGICLMLSLHLDYCHASITVGTFVHWFQREREREREYLFHISLFVSFREKNCLMETTSQEREFAKHLSASCID